MRPILSVCIPTYNRARFLPETLESIIRQATDDVEIVISDNASTDGTPAIVAKYEQRFPRIRYQIWPQNMGADHNYMRAVALASGRYCWLFGSDDCMPLGAIRRVLGEIAEGHDIYLVNRRNCTSSMVPVSDLFYLNSSVGDCLFDFSVKPFGEYLELCRSLGGLFSYLSSIIIRKQAWDGCTCAPEFFGTAYSHAYVLLSMVRHGCRLKYVAEPLVLNRAGFDSFETGDPGARVNLDLRGYSMLADALFGDDRDARQGIFRVLYQQCRVQYFPLRRFLKIRSLSRPATWEELRQNYIRLWGSSWEIRLVDAARLPSWVTRGALKLKHAFR